MFQLFDFYSSLGEFANVRIVVLPEDSSRIIIGVQTDLFLLTDFIVFFDDDT